MTALKKTIASFKQYLEELGYSKMSCDQLPKSVGEFIDFHSLSSLRAVERGQIHDFYEWLQIRPNKRREGALSEMSIVHGMFSLRIFFGWLEKTGQLSENPMSGIRIRRAVATVREPLTEEEIGLLFGIAERLRDRAILHLFYSCGLRRSEAERLNIRDVAFKKRLLYVREGKGARRRAVPMPQKVAAELEAYYLEERMKSKIIKNEDAFMISQFGKRMSGSGYYVIFKSLVKTTAIEREVSLHHLRHSIATHLLKAGLSVEAVRDFLGHRQLESTQVYVKVSQDQLKGL